MDDMTCKITLSGDSALNLSDAAADCGVCPECYLTAALETFEQIPLSIKRTLVRGGSCSFLVGFPIGND